MEGITTVVERAAPASSAGLVERLRARLHRHPSPAPRRRCTFLDTELQSVFERDGFVVVDLLDAAQVAELQRRYDRLDHARHESWAWVDGFETSLYDDRPDYRRQILEDAEAVASASLASLLDRHRIMFANWVVKIPGAQDVPLHADWTFLDEDLFSSVTVWCPLVDTSLELHNGALGLVVGSHREIDFVRVANVPAYDRCVDAVSDLDRCVPDIRAGQAVVLDNRVVHFSPPNETAEQRVALGCVIGPVEADLHHYWLDDHGQLLRFELDRSFYLGYTIGQPNQADGILGITEVPPVATD